MYFTTFTYSDGREFSIIHKDQAQPYADDLARYPNYFEVTKKPTFHEAEVIFKICKAGNLCARIENATTIKLEAPDPNKSSIKNFVKRNLKY